MQALRDALSGPGFLVIWAISAAVALVVLVVDLTIGLMAAYPVNVLLIVGGVKSGMHDPREAPA